MKMNSAMPQPPASMKLSMGDAVHVKKQGRKILFLDIDGVLNSVGQNILDDTYDIPTTALDIDRRPCMILNLLFKEMPDVEVVLSSSRRILKELEWFQTAFKLQGMANVRLVDRTPRINTANRIRGDEIQAWLDENKSVDKYVILDDDTDMLPSQMPNFVHVNRLDGFGFINLRQVLLKFAGDRYSNKLCDELFSVSK